MKDGKHNKIQLQKYKHYFPHFKNLLFLIKYIIILLSIKISNEHQRNLINYLSEIHLIISSNGTQRLLGNTFYKEPYEVKVNGILKNSCKKTCDFDYEENNVTLYFNTPIISCEKMFYESINIKEIDLSNFDFSNVISMAYMFANCINLEKINFGNINTSFVKVMNHVFYNCSKLTSLNISTFDTSSIISMEGMFYYCINLLSIDLSSFNTDNVESLGFFIARCEKLTSIDISHFNTSKVKSMDYLFSRCNNIKKLNLQNLNTSLVSKMEGLFHYCEKLEFLDLRNFDTSLVVSMGWMFNACYKIKRILFSEKFNTSKVTVMYSMFSLCYLLTDLNLSSFDTSKVTQMVNMFAFCESLKYLDISNFAPINITQMNYMFKNMYSLVYLNINSLEISEITTKEDCFLNIPNNIKICANQINMKNYLLSLNIVINCSDFCFDKESKLDINTNECIYSCKDRGYHYEYNRICYDNCPNETTYFGEDGICYENIETTLVVIGTTYNDYNKMISTSIQNKISDTPKELAFSTHNSLNENLYPTNKLLTYEESINITKTTFNNQINSLQSNIISESIITQKNYSINNFINNSTTHNEYIYKTDFIIKGNNEEIYQGVIDNVILNYDISKGEEMVFQGENNFFFHITNSENELDLLKGNNNSTNKFSIIDLGYCEDILKEHYHLNKNTSLLIIKFEKLTNISSERSLQYEVFEPYNKTKLNLSICKNITIDIYIPIVLTEKMQNLYEKLNNLGYDLFDINSPFYQDICTPYKSEDGTDVPLNDRINSFYNNGETSCQSNCKYSDYLMESQYLKCDCDIINSEINTQDTEKFNTKTIYQSFFSVLKYSNYKVLKCFKLAFTLNSLTINIGSILSIIYFIIYLIFLSIYILRGINQLKTGISKKVSEKNILNINTKDKPKIKKNQTINNKTFFKETNNKNNNKVKNKNKENIILKNTKRKRKGYQEIIFTNPPKKNSFLYREPSINSNNRINYSKEKYENNILDTNKISSLNTGNKYNEIKEKNEVNKQIADIMVFNKKEKEKEELDNYELNNLEFVEAKELDKRNFLEIYWSLLKREHLIIFTFITKDDHNITFIKYSRFVFLLCTDMAMNVFFFSDETMHKLFLDYGKYNFIQQIPQIIYSTLISKLIEIFLCFLSLTDKHYYLIKDCKKISKSSLIGIMKCIQIKIGFFFGFTSFMFTFYWYLITCFCSVYQNTQIAFIKDTFLSFLLGNLIPFILYLIPSLLRIISLKSNKYRLEWIYNISNIIPFF